MIDILVRKFRETSNVEVLIDIYEVFLDPLKLLTGIASTNHLCSRIFHENRWKIEKNWKKSKLTNIKNSARVLSFSVGRSDPTELKILSGTYLTITYNILKNQRNLRDWTFTFIRVSQTRTLKITTLKLKNSQKTGWWPKLDK